MADVGANRFGSLAIALRRTFATNLVLLQQKVSLHTDKHFGDLCFCFQKKFTTRTDTTGFSLIFGKSIEEMVAMLCHVLGKTDQKCRRLESVE